MSVCWLTIKCGTSKQINLTLRLQVLTPHSALTHFPPSPGTPAVFSLKHTFLGLIFLIFRYIRKSASIHHSHLSLYLRTAPIYRPIINTPSIFEKSHPNSFFFRFRIETEPKKGRKWRTRQTGSSCGTETSDAVGKHNTSTNQHLKYQRSCLLIKAKTNGH